MHGKTSEIRHNGAGLFENIAQPFRATRYHSLVVKRDSLPNSLTVVAEADDGEIMGLRHRHFPIEGVQFHPEVTHTPLGSHMLHNFVTAVCGCAGTWKLGDFAKQSIPKRHSLQPYFFKRKSFSWEREVRIIGAMEMGKRIGSARCVPIGPSSRADCLKMEEPRRWNRTTAIRSRRS